MSWVFALNFNAKKKHTKLFILVLKFSPLILNMLPRAYDDMHFIAFFASISFMQNSSTHKNLKKEARKSETCVFVQFMSHKQKKKKNKQKNNVVFNPCTFN